jgi:hypothetical protein
MINCQACRSENQDSSQYCDECGSRLVNNQKKYTRHIEKPNLQKLISESQIFQPANVTSIGIPPIAENLPKHGSSLNNVNTNDKNVRAKLVIERGNAAGTEFKLRTDESYIGRWDADNGIFPDIDLDKHDSEAKVSRRHARIVYAGGKFSIEDLGSTNGTYVNRGRRLIPGNAQVLNAGDEIIVGKTFLRFYVED